ncbi:MAG: methyl-accepting chemotaxis protein, partial [Pseudomonadota bacterium]
FAHLMRQEQAYTDQLVDAVSQVNRDHNLSVRIPESATNDSGRAFNRLLSDVEQLISELAGASGQLGTVSEQLKSSSDDATQSSENQHRAVSDASDAMVELTATIEAVSQNAQQTAEVTAEADIQVRTGEERVAVAIKKTHTLVSGMEEANKSIETLSERVSSIGAVVDVIRDISEQTNLLALNAAIEAARAGEHGRGFAVVSDEVRELAQRTRSSTEEIQDIIESLQKTTNTAVSHINQGREASERTAEAMNSADESFKGISEIVQRINEMSASNASSTEQQSASIKGITENIGRVSEFSVGSVDNAQKAQSAATELAELAGTLESKIRRYTR